MSIPPDLSQRLHKTLLRCTSFDSDQALAAVFVDERISLWAADLPESSSKGGRVRAILKYLADKHNTQDENVLVLFLHVLYEPLAPTDGLRQELSTLAAELEQYAPTPDTPQWDTALDRYREWVKYTYGTMRILGKHEPVSVEGIYTDVYMLDKPSASYYLDPLKDLATTPRERRDGLKLVMQPDHQHFVILGQPGAGKTTFLKHIALQAADGKLGDRAPILVYLREWTGGELMDFLTRPLSNGGIADPPALMEHLLCTGRALLLLDGLDEVNELQRRDLIRSIEEFHRRYMDCRILLTCRVAATPHQFEDFSEVEVADFTEEQMLAFARNWFGGDTPKAEEFQNQIQQEERLRDLGHTPLLLGMLCLIFDEQGAFPEKRAELYQRALDALLVEWDESRSIEREAMRRAEIYYSLSLGRKHQLFAHIAHTTFERGKTLIPQERLERLITDYLATTPNAPARIDIDAGAILEAIEAQHGILVEYAQRMYAFAHPTFQEYYTAHYIVEQARDGDKQALPRLLTHTHEERWHEVTLLTVSMMENANTFFSHFLAILDKSIREDAELIAIFKWNICEAATMNTNDSSAVVRIVHIWLVLDLYFAYDLAGDISQLCDRTRAQAYLSNLLRLFSVIRNLAAEFNKEVFLFFSRDYDLDSNLHSSFKYVLGSLISHAKILSNRLNFYDLYVALRSLDASRDTPQETRNAFVTLFQTVMIEHLEISRDWHLSIKQIQTLERYFTAAYILVQCLNVANISAADRVAIENRLLLPPKRETKSV